MSTPNSPPLSIHTDTNVSSDALAAAAECRMRQQSPVPSAAQIAADHEKRQAFRRLIEPGIMRPNSYPSAMDSLKTLLTIAENLLAEPDNPKYQRFKPTNPTIKHRLVDPKGTLEFAIALGFRPEVQDFQPYYVFNPRKIPDLRMGADILKDFICLETQKRERADQSKKDAKAAAEAAAVKVKLAFLDDRKTKTLHDEREKTRREARAIAGRRESLQQESPVLITAKEMPGSGHVLGGELNEDSSNPPGEGSEDDVHDV